MSKPLPVIQPLAPPGAEHLVEVAFKGNRREFYTTTDAGVREGDYVIVEAERGQDLGRVRSVGGVAKSKCSSTGAEATRPVVRHAEPEEVREGIVLRTDEERVRRQTREMVEKHGLKMKVTEAEWQWDRNKLTVYFTAERRVDFRELVRDLARTFRTRIELKQIGVRDEAAMLGGLGRCGRQLCCATWLREIRPVSLQLAKDQNLSLNPSQISGTCGRLMCCLTYEHDSYLQARKRFPREGKVLQTSRGAEKVIGIDIWRDSVTLLDESRQRRVITLAELKKEIGAPGAAARSERTGESRPEARTRPAEAVAPRQPPRERPEPALRADAPPAPTTPDPAPETKRRKRPEPTRRNRAEVQGAPKPDAAKATSGAAEEVGTAGAGKKKGRRPPRRPGRRTGGKGE
jgi:cell fate regulator YaaT (PSP1 superfamily)